VKTHALSGLPRANCGKLVAANPYFSLIKNHSIQPALGEQISEFRKFDASKRKNIRRRENSVWKNSPQFWNSAVGQPEEYRQSATLFEQINKVPRDI